MMTAPLVPLAELAVAITRGKTRKFMVLAARSIRFEIGPFIVLECSAPLAMFYDLRFAG